MRDASSKLVTLLFFFVNFALPIMTEYYFRKDDILMITLGTIILLIAAALVLAGVLGIVLDVFSALGLVLAIPFALAGKEVILIAIGVGMFIYLKKKDIF